jgi:hypothetical protein
MLLDPFSTIPVLGIASAAHKRGAGRASGNGDLPVSRVSEVFADNVSMADARRLHKPIGSGEAFPEKHPCCATSSAARAVPAIDTTP